IEHKFAAIGFAPLRIEIQHSGQDSVTATFKSIQVFLIESAWPVTRQVRFVIKQAPEQFPVESLPQLVNVRQVIGFNRVEPVQPMDGITADVGINGLLLLATNRSQLPLAIIQ